MINIYYHKASLEHKLYPLFSEKPRRLEVLISLFNEKGISLIAGHKATDEALTRAHSQKYIDHVETISKAGLFKAFLSNTLSQQVQWYTRVSKGSYIAALYAAGGACQAVEDVLMGRCKKGFCLTRPPGHHAGREKGEGFCIFNNVAIGALHALENGAKRVAIVDFDRHHGNGTEEIVRHHDNILFISSFQEACKYATKAKKRENTIPVSIPEHSTFEVVKELYEKEVIPALHTFKPDLILISAGFDMHIDDPLTNIKLESKDFYTLTKMLVESAGVLCEGRVVSVLEGGYDVDALKECVGYHIEALEGD